MILYVCSQDGNYLMTMSLLEAFLSTPAGSYVCVCQKCGTPMYRVQPGDRLYVKRAIESTTPMIEVEKEKTDESRH